MNEETNPIENEGANDPLRQLRDRLVNETGLSPNFVSRCLDGDMDALAQLDERDDRQLKLLLGGLCPRWTNWLLVLYETSLPLVATNTRIVLSPPGKAAETQPRGASWEWRLAGGKPVLDAAKLIVREIVTQREFVTVEEEEELDAAVRDKILECTALSEAQYAEILECSVEVFRKLRRGLSGRGLVFFEPVQENRFRIYVRSNAEICRNFLVPLMEIGKEFGFFFFERFPPPLVQTIQ